MRIVIAISLLITVSSYGQFSPPAGHPGSIAIYKDSSAIIGWANQVVSINPGPQDISSTESITTVFGMPSDATGPAEGTSTDVVSLGDGGSITLSFNYPITNEDGPDFVVFENSFSDDFLEFAHVEVSTNGNDFVRIPSECQIPIGTQTATFGTSNTEQVHNLAGKFRQGYGTPFDLQDVIDSTLINVDSILFVRIIDVVGSINPAYGSYDSYGTIINDPFPTDFESSGFDLDAVGVIHALGEFTVGIEEQENITIYPNPSTRYVKISNSETDWVLYNMKGTAITDGSGSLVDISSYDVDAGVYLLQCVTDRSASTHRIIYSPN